MHNLEITKCSVINWYKSNRKCQCESCDSVYDIKSVINIKRWNVLKVLINLLIVGSFCYFKNLSRKRENVNFLLHGAQIMEEISWNIKVLAPITISKKDYNDTCHSKQIDKIKYVTLFQIILHND